MEDKNNVNELFEEFNRKVENLRQLGRSWDLREEQINDCIKQVFGDNREPRPIKKNRLSLLISRICNVCQFFICVVFIIVLVYVMISFHNPTQRFFVRHVQDLIYPSMRLLRLLTLPFLSVYGNNFSGQWYAERCLILNPFFKGPLLDCWPCEGVQMIANISKLINFTEIYYHGGIPFVVKDAMNEEISLNILQQVFYQNKLQLQKGTVAFSSSTPNIQSPEELLHLSHQIPDDLHATWKLNRVAAAQVLRSIFHRPYFIPKETEVAIEKFLFINGPKAPSYTLPLTDFANVWLTQGKGHRYVVLSPSSQCRKMCASVSLILQPKDVLFYNWQFWRAKSFPIEESDEISITFMGSFY